MRPQKDKWRAIFENWKLFSSPGRPNEEVIFEFAKRIKKAIHEKTEPVIVLLGATPEFRDLAYNFYLTDRAKLISIDRSRDNYEVMSHLTKLKNPNETFVHEDWRKTTLDNKISDVIISDAAISNIPFDDRGIFYREMLRIMKNDGRLITREDVLIRQYHLPEFEHMLDLYAQKVKGHESTLLYAVNIIGELCLRIGASNNGYVTDSDYFDGCIKSVLEGRDPVKKEIAELLKQTYLKKTNDSWFIGPKVDFEKELTDFFDIEEIIVNKTYELAETLPIYTLKKPGITAQ